MAESFQIKDFSLIWKIQEWKSLFEYCDSVTSPPIPVTASHQIKFSLTINEEIGRLTVVNDSNLRLKLNDCEINITDNSEKAFSALKIEDKDESGWEFNSSQILFSSRRDVNQSNVQFKCHLFLGEPVIVPSYSSLEELDLLKLSRDIKKLYLCPKLSDLKLHCRDEVFHVHKAILSARASNFIKELAIIKDSLGVNHVTKMLPSVLRAALQYFYFDALKAEDSMTSAGLLLAADILKIEKLKKKLCAYPEKLVLFTHAPSAQFEFSWPVKNFSSIKLENPTFLKSTPLLCTKFSDHCQVDLRLELKKSDTVALKEVHLQVSVCFHLKYLLSKYFVKSKTSVLDIFGDLHDTEYQQFPLEESDLDVDVSKWIIVKSIKVKDLQDESAIFLPNDILSFMFAFTIFRPEHEILESAYKADAFESISLNMDDAQQLSIDLMQLYISQEHSDLVLRANRKLYKVHRIIINARAPKMLSDSHYQKEIHLSNIEPEVLEALLMYVYSAKIPELNCSFAMKLYLIAYKYEITLLKQKCLDFVKRNLTF